MRCDEFLFPKDLEVTKAKLDKVLLIGTCTAEFFYLQFREMAPQTKFDFILKGYADILPERDKETSYDLTFLHIPHATVIGGSISSFNLYSNPVFRNQIRQNAFDTIDVLLDTGLKYNKEAGDLTFVSNFFVPQRSISASLDDEWGDADLRTLIGDCNNYLRDALRRYKNVYLADIDSVGNALGKRYFLDDMTFTYNHGGVYFPDLSDIENRAPWAAPEPGRIESIPPVSEFYPYRFKEYFETIYRQTVSLYRSITQIDMVKLVIFDLDNTLWRGQIAQHYGDDRQWPPIDGWPPSVWEAIQHLRSRGILVAICSKNDEQLVIERWNRPVMDGWLSLDHFVIKKINWKPKAENIAEILAELSLTAKSVVFVDDNPIERESVRAAFPDIRVIGSNPFLTRRILLWSAETKGARLTNESVRREEMMRGQIQRNAASKTKSRDEFLESLECIVKLRSVKIDNREDLGRCLELMNKTNQFNTTGRRWSDAELGNVLRAKDTELYCFYVKDRFVEYGLVGVILIENNVVVQFVMSCRVLGLEIETSVISYITSVLRDRGAAAVCAQVVKTESNSVSRDVYERSGFANVENSGERLIYEARAITGVSKHITLLYEDQLRDGP